jgi:CBS domain-containing protein
VDEVMTRKVHCVLPRQTSEECMSLMTSNRMRHLPVMDETRKLQG